MRFLALKSASAEVIANDAKEAPTLTTHPTTTNRLPAQPTTPALLVAPT